MTLFLMCQLRKVTIQYFIIVVQDGTIEFGNVLLQRRRHGRTRSFDGNACPKSVQATQVRLHGLDFLHQVHDGRRQACLHDGRKIESKTIKVPGLTVAVAEGDPMTAGLRCRLEIDNGAAFLSFEIRTLVFGKDAHKFARMQRPGHVL